MQGTAEGQAKKRLTGNRLLSGRHRLAATLLALTCLASGCASLKEDAPQDQAREASQQQREDCECDDTATAQARKAAPDLSEQRLILSEGYSLLHRDAKRLNLSDLLLLAKSESDVVKDMVRDVAEFGGNVEKNLERIAKDYPGVRIDLDPLPDMEKRKRFAIAKDRAIEFAPGIGRGGRDYERTILISLLNGINHERHMCKVMAKEETDANLKKFLLDTEKGYDGLYDRIEELLDREYFK